MSREAILACAVGYGLGCIATGYHLVRWRSRLPWDAGWGAGPFELLLVVWAVILGRNFPVQLGFRGGNGLATGVGALLVFDPPLALALAVCFAASLPTLSVLRTRFGVPVE